MPSTSTIQTSSSEVPAPRKQRDLRRLIARVALILWMPTVAFGVGSLMVGHWAPLPMPEAGENAKLTTALRELITQPSDPGTQDPRTNGRWSLVHVLFEGCGCSRNVQEYLLAADRETSAEEWVLLVASKTNSRWHSALRAQGFRTSIVSAEGLLTKFGIEAAPLFAVLDPEQRLRFVGGYTARKQSLAYQDIAALDALRSGLAPSPLPVFGCGVSNALQSALDPLGLKY